MKDRDAEAPDGPDVVVQNPNGYREAGDLRPWLRALLKELSPASDSFGVRLVGDRAMRELNRGYRQRDSATDVLSFPGEPTRDGVHLGDVVISIPTARRQAEEQGHSAATELQALLLHGVLHCMGHDHESDQGEMERLERRLRREWVHIDA